MLESQYFIAWSIYLLSGFVCSFIWWRLTGRLMHRGWRDLCRGFFVVLIFTPCYSGETSEFFAPAFIVLVMDFLLEGTKPGLRGALTLLFSSFVMLLTLMVRTLFLKAK